MTKNVEKYMENLGFYKREEPSYIQFIKEFNMYKHEITLTKDGSLKSEWVFKDGDTMGGPLPINVLEELSFYYRIKSGGVTPSKMRDLTFLEKKELYEELIDKRKKLKKDSEELNRKIEEIENS